MQAQSGIVNVFSPQPPITVSGRILAVVEWLGWGREYIVRREMERKPRVQRVSGGKVRLQSDRAR